MKLNTILLTSLISTLLSLGLLSLFSFNINNNQNLVDDVPIGTIIIWSGNTKQVTPPASNWRLCDGKRMSVEYYPELYQVLKFDWRRTTDANYFYLPDLRGVFIRGNNERKKLGQGQNLQMARFTDSYQRYRFNSTSKLTTDFDLVGSYQFDEIQTHFHPAHKHEMKSHRHGFKDVVINESTSNRGGINYPIETRIGSGSTDFDNGYGYYVYSATDYEKSDMYESGTNSRGVSENTVKNAAVNYYIKVK